MTRLKNRHSARFGPRGASQLAKIGIAAGALFLFLLVLAVIEFRTRRRADDLATSLAVADTLPAPKPAPAAAREYEFTPANGGFRVKFPCTAKESSKLEQAGEHQILQHTAVCESKQSYFSAFWFERIKGDEMTAAERAEAVANGSLNGMKESAGPGNYQVTRSEPGEWDGLPSYEAEGSLKQQGLTAQFRLRVVVTKTTIYGVLALGSPNQASTALASVDTFHLDAAP